MKNFIREYRKASREANDLKLRLVGIPLIGFMITGFMFIDNYDVFGPNIAKGLIGFLVSTTMTLIFWTTQRFVIITSNILVPDYRNLFRRLIVTLLLAKANTAVITFPTSYLLNVLFNGGTTYWDMFKISIIPSIFVSLVYEVIRYTRGYNQAKMLAERLQHEQTQSQFDSLKQQLSPHFLFNSLNTLAGLIEQDAVKATRFVEKLSAVYRYILRAGELKLTPLADEIEFAKAYLFLIEIRFGDKSLDTNYKISDNAMQMYIPPLTIQLLLENATKHNIVSQTKPLQISIIEKEVDGKPHLEISNYYQPRLRPVGESNGTGLINLVNRFEILGGHQILINQTENKFVVTVPLLFNPN